MLKNPSAQQVWRLAEKQGAEPLFMDGLEKVKNGITTIEELLRVAIAPEERKVQLEDTATIVEEFKPFKRAKKIIGNE